jgi:NAD(P)-dependent dehydrogenase (short-subunit alcohol dehydrogenase family)
MMNDLRGKVALITGSSSGIGAETAKLFATHGVKVMLTGHIRAEGEAVCAEINALGAEAHFVHADLLHTDTPALLIRETIAKWGRLDILVNSAGIQFVKSIDEVKPEDWDLVLQINLKAPFFMAQAAIPWLEKQGGVIINLSSTNAMIGDYKDFIYDSSKAALNHLTKGLAMDLKDRNIRVNAVMPGGTLTPMVSKWLRMHRTDENEIPKILENLKTAPFVATPTQIANVIVFLASDLGNWINGAEIPVDGGKVAMR